MIDEATAKALAILITAFGGPALLISLGRTIWKWWTGRSARERTRNRDIVADLRSAEDRADDEAVLKRKALEYCSVLRRQLLDAKIAPAPWPEGLTAYRRAPRKTDPKKQGE